MGKKNKEAKKQETCPVEPPPNPQSAPQHDVNCTGTCWQCNPLEMKQQGQSDKK